MKNVPSPAGYIYAHDAAALLWKDFSPGDAEAPDWVDADSARLFSELAGAEALLKEEADLLVEEALCQLVSTGVYAWNLKSDPVLFSCHMESNESLPETQYFNTYSSLIAPPGSGVMVHLDKERDDECEIDAIFAPTGRQFALRDAIEARLQNFENCFALFKANEVDAFLNRGKMSIRGKKAPLKPAAFERRLPYFDHLKNDEVLRLSWKQVLRIFEENGEHVGRETARKFLPELKERRGLPRR